MKKYVKIWYTNGEIIEYNDNEFSFMSVNFLTSMLNDSKKVIKFEITIKG